MNPTTTCLPFERTSKRRRGFPSETHVKRGHRTVRGGEVELLEKLGRNDLCPCGSGRRFQAVLLEDGLLLTALCAMTTTASDAAAPVEAADREGGRLDRSHWLGTFAAYLLESRSR